MVTARDLSYGLYVAWRFVLLDRSAMQYVDNSVDGFWKSFFAAVIVAPAYLIVAALVYFKTDAPLQAGFVEIVIVQATAYVMSWVAFPLAMATVSELLQRGERYIGYIVAYNWAQVVVMAVSLPVILLVAASGVPLDEPNAMRSVVFFAVAFYLWFIARTALSISGWAAAGIVALDLILAQTIDKTAYLLLT